MLSPRRCLNENVHLLSDVKRHIAVGESIDRLEYSCIHAFRTIPCEGLLGDDVWFKPNELERCAMRTITTFGSFGWTSRLDAPCVVFVNVRANVKFPDVTHDEQGARQLSRLRVFTGAHVHLEDLSFDRRPHCETGKVRFHTVNEGFRIRQL